MRDYPALSPADLSADREQLELPSSQVFSTCVCTVLQDPSVHREARQEEIRGGTQCFNC